MSAVYSALETSHTNLLNSYDENIAIVQALQQTLIQDIIPDVLDEMEGMSVLYDEEGIKRWARDSENLFRVLKRQKFTTSFTIQALRSSVIWRLTSLSVYLSSMNRPDTTGVVQVLPRPYTDPFGRPVLVFNLAAFFSLLSKSLDDAKDLILLVAENLRLYLRQLNERDGHDTPILQYAVIVNVEGVSWSGSAPDLLTWYLQDVQPHFPAMLAAVFLQGHSWMHSRMWNIVKHVIPTSAQNKVIFSSQAELVDYFGAESLPQEYGGILPPLAEMEDPLARILRNPTPRRLGDHHHRSLSLPVSVTPTTPVEFNRPSAQQSITATHSPINPFFGYPVLPDSMHPRHGRRRKRDLFATLALLWWTKWKNTIMWWSLGAVVLLIMRKRMADSFRLRAQQRLALAQSKLADPVRLEKLDRVGEVIRYWRNSNY